jgi:hypothetical protein
VVEQPKWQSCVQAAPRPSVGELLIQCLGARKGLLIKQKEIELPVLRSIVICNKNKILNKVTK